MVRITILSRPTPVISELTGLELTFDDIANGPVSDATSVTDWNTFFDLPTNGSPFTSVVVNGAVVTLYGGSGINISDGLFLDNTYKIISFNDLGGCIISAGYRSFYDLEAGGVDIDLLHLPALVTAGDECFRKISSVLNYIFPSLQSIGDRCFMECSNVNSFYLPICLNLGISVDNDLVFFGVQTETITLTIPAALMTCNGGNPDGDIQYLQANNKVTIVYSDAPDNGIIDADGDYLFDSDGNFLIWQ